MIKMTDHKRYLLNQKEKKRRKKDDSKINPKNMGKSVVSSKLTDQQWNRVKQVWTRKKDYGTESSK